jgi:hypothetical protein
VADDNMREAPHQSSGNQCGAAGAESSRAVDAARFVADVLGWGVFPVYEIERGRCSCLKGQDCGSPGKHPRTRNGVKDATTDPAVIDAWDRRWPNANWATTPGERGVVVDIDPRKDGFTSMREWGDLESSWSVTTGGAGRHLYFTADEPLANRNNWLSGVDVKASGGYVLLPGSNHISGGSYVWDGQPPGAGPPPAPRDLRDSLSRVAAGGSTSPGPDEPSSRFSGFLEGGRDDGLFRLACRLRNDYEDDREAVEAHVLLVASRCDPPFPREQARAKVDQAFAMERFEVTPEQIAWAQQWRVAEDATRPRLNLTKGRQVRARARPPMMIDGALPPRGLFQIFGQTGAYKTFVIVDLLCSIANGIDWMGHKVNEPGLVALVLGEGGWDAGDRLAAWLAAHPGCTDDLVVYSLEEGLDLMDRQQIEHMTSDLLAYRDAEHPDEEWRCVIFDTQADHMPNGDEDKSGDFTIIKKSIQQLAQATGAAVGLVHHTGWDDSRERGSSRQRQALDVVMQVKDQRIVNVKNKYAPKFESVTFTVEAVEEVGSVYVRQATESDQMRLAFEAVQAGGHDEPTAVKALATLHEQPGISGNQMTKTLAIKKESWGSLRSWLEVEGYIACQRNDKGTVQSFAITDSGIEWLLAKGAS